MSIEFENAVLRKLDVLNSRFDNLENNYNARFDKLEANYDNLNARFDNLENNYNARFDKLEANNNDLNSKFSNLDANYNDLNSKLNEHTKLINKCLEEIHDTQEILISLNNSFIRHEHESNKKFKALFDSFCLNSDNHKVYDDHITSLNSKIYNHDIRISTLEDYNKNSKLLAAN